MRSREKLIDLLVHKTGPGMIHEPDKIRRMWAQEYIDAVIKLGRELERAEMERRLRSALDTQIATHLMEGTNPDAPAWVWFGDCDRQEVSLGRWHKHPSQALYIRSDLIRDAMNAENGQ